MGDDPVWAGPGRTIRLQQEGMKLPGVAPSHEVDAGGQQPLHTILPAPALYIDTPLIRTTSKA
jgi:hypothetical protein